jgi:putative acetyltransferase
MRVIVEGDFSDPRVIDLVRFHISSSRAETPPGSAHALELSGLRSADIDFWALWDGQMLLGIGALKRLARDHGEVKSMHIVAAARRTGAGSAMLRHIIASARNQGLSRLSLETGSSAYFEPARVFYQRHGFRECPPFGNYAPDPNSVFMTLDLRD